MTKPDYTHAKKILTALEEGKTVEIATFYSYSFAGWKKINDSKSWDIDALNDPDRIRVKPEPEYVPLEAEDIPAVCWINSTASSVGTQLVSFIGNYGLVANSCSNYLYQQLMRESYYYSEDRKNWKLCRKEKI